MQLGTSGYIIGSGEVPVVGGTIRHVALLEGGRFLAAFDPPLSYDGEGVVLSTSIESVREGVHAGPKRGIPMIPGGPSGFWLLAPNRSAAMLFTTMDQAGVPAAVVLHTWRYHVLVECEQPPAGDYTVVFGGRVESFEDARLAVV
jgi:hypothetical protein